ncbi:LiaI-LiaF-like domain-containing protein [Halobacillus sp. K22]|uniref:LiaI-LiaF-like domain-containing protein n=1 Tax=Halobacillus sp. K22 TaxID=3457431 RepID=UPI003FCDD8C7
MTKQNSFIGFLLIGFGLYFLLRQLNIPYLSEFYSWPTLLFIIGAAFLLHSYIAKDHSSLFTGALMLGFGVHFHAIHHLAFWKDDWPFYLLVIGVAFLIRYAGAKKGLIPALLFLGFGFFALFWPVNPEWFQWIQTGFQTIIRYWPLVLIVSGLYLLKK